MAHYLVQATYSQQSWESMLASPQNRAEAIKPVIEELGGSIKGMWFAFGEYDAIAIVEMPDNASAAAFSLAASSAGVVSAFKTTPLMSIEDLEAMGYKIAAYPLTLLNTAVFAMQEALEELKQGRTPERRVDFQTIRSIVGFSQYDQLIDAYAERY